MPKYRNTKTGVVVDIPADLAARIGFYEPVEQPVKREKKPQSRKSKSE